MLKKYLLPQIPNFFTLSRVFLTYPVWILLEKNFFILGFILFVFSLLTDFIDGNLARQFNLTSSLGALLDPIADKLTLLIYLTLINTTSELIPLWYVVIAYARNTSQLMSVPILMWWLKKPFKVKPKKFPKYGTALNFTLLVIAIYLQHNTFEQLTDLNNLLTHFLTFVIIPASTYFEVHILLTYVPRLIQIATDKHDTFE